MKILCILLFGALITNTFGQSDTLRIKKHLSKITQREGYRNSDNPSALNATAAYIYQQFDRYADTTYFQKFTANGIEYKNVICVIGKNRPKTIVVGAHYDVCGEQEGADDNASGVVGLLELAKLTARADIDYRLEIVAYTLEEPPYFRTKNMGSAIHAKSLRDRKESIEGMICLEMIGYFKQERGTQKYPLGIFKLFKGSRANYITLVRKNGGGKFAKTFSKTFRKNAFLPAKKFVGPVSLAGIDYSDHSNYWNEGYSTLMITDTSFYRNPHYHEKTDTMETLDVKQMAAVIDSLVLALIEMK